MDLSCLSCTECGLVFKNTDNVYCITCGHLYHLDCLRFGRINRPKCVKCNALQNTIIKLQFIFNNDSETKLRDGNVLRAKTEALIKELEEKLDNLKREIFSIQISSPNNYDNSKIAPFSENTSAEKLKYHEDLFDEMVPTNAEDSFLDNEQRSCSILYYPEEKLSTPLVSIILMICKLMSMDDITEDDILEISSYKSIHSNEVKLTVEFKSQLARNRFLENRNFFFDYAPLMHSNSIEIVEFLSDEDYELCTYAFYYFGIRMPCKNSRLSYTVNFSSKKSIYEFVSKIKSKKLIKF